MANYWAERQAKAQEKLTQKNVKQVEAQLGRYYASTMKKILGQFETIYNNVSSNIEDGKTPTPADLYKLDSYWQMQNQLQTELRKLGDFETALLGKKFMVEFQEIYKTLAIPGEKAFSTIDAAMAKEMVNQVWCADGVAWSQRVWNNTGKLQQELNENLIDCLVTGKKTTDLTKRLEERFNVSYSRANTLVRTEMAHIQTQAAAKRYEDYGLEKYEILGNDDDSCGNHGVDCHALDGKQFYYREMKVGVNAPPFHPNCKCCIVPVVE
jgi:SPP1 gp7 family putative phage head morphogenesis protein